MDDVEYTCFRYIRWLDIYNSEKPFQVLIDLPADAEDRRRTNIEFHDGSREAVRNARSDMSTFDIDKHGFTFVKHQTALQQPDFLDREAIERVYLPECKELLQASLEGVDRVHIFNWLTRDTNMSTVVGKERDLNEPIATLGPGTTAHVGMYTKTH